MTFSISSLRKAAKNPVAVELDKGDKVTLGVDIVILAVVITVIALSCLAMRGTALGPFNVFSRLGQIGTGLIGGLGALFVTTDIVAALIFLARKSKERGQILTPTPTPTPSDELPTGSTSSKNPSLRGRDRAPSSSSESEKDVIGESSSEHSDDKTSSESDSTILVRPVVEGPVELRQDEAPPAPPPPAPPTLVGSASEASMLDQIRAGSKLKKTPATPRITLLDQIRTGSKLKQAPKPQTEVPAATKVLEDKVAKAKILNPDVDVQGAADDEWEEEAKAYKPDLTPPVKAETPPPVRKEAEIPTLAEALKSLDDSLILLNEMEKEATPPSPSLPPSKPIPKAPVDIYAKERKVAAEKKEILVTRWKNQAALVREVNHLIDEFDVPRLKDFKRRVAEMKRAGEVVKAYQKNQEEIAREKEEQMANLSIDCSILPFVAEMEIEDTPSGELIKKMKETIINKAKSTEDKLLRISLCMDAITLRILDFIDEFANPAEKRKGIKERELKSAQLLAKPDETPQMAELDKQVTQFPLLIVDGKTFSLATLTFLEWDALPPGLKLYFGQNQIKIDDYVGYTKQCSLLHARMEAILKAPTLKQKKELYKKFIKDFAALKKVFSEMEKLFLMCLPAPSAGE